MPLLQKNSVLADSTKCKGDPNSKSKEGDVGDVGDVHGGGGKNKKSGRRREKEKKKKNNSGR